MGDGSGVVKRVAHIKDPLNIPASQNDIDIAVQMFDCAPAITTVNRGDGFMINRADIHVVFWGSGWGKNPCVAGTNPATGSGYVRCTKRY
jgi:hypothetical protein